MATLSITVPDAQVPRVQEAIGDAMGLRNAQGTARVATTAEVQAFIADHIKQRVHAYEAQKAANAAAAAVTDITAS